MLSALIVGQAWMLGTANVIAKKKKPQRTMPKGLHKKPIIIIAQKARFVKMFGTKIQDQIITDAERHGSLCRNEIEIVGTCENCGETIISGDEYYVDKDKNKFCTDDCYIKFYEIEKKGNGLWQS